MARKILGKLAKNMTDDEVKQDIETATLFKELFFEIMFSRLGNNKLYNDSSVN